MFYYILNNDGYLKAVFLGCLGEMEEECKSWEGEIPYDLEENLGAYKFGNGEELSRMVDFKQGVTLDDKGNEISNNDYNYFVTDYIPVYPSRAYVYSRASLGDCYGAYYDEEYNFISSFTINDTPNGDPQDDSIENYTKTMEIPDGARYVRFTGSLSSGRYWASLLNVGDDLSGKTLYCNNIDSMVESDDWYIATSDGDYTIMGSIVGGLRRIWINKESTLGTVATLYEEGIRDNMPYTLPDDFGKIVAVYPNNPNYKLMTYETEDSDYRFKVYSTDELVLDEVKLEELQNNIFYDYSTSEVFTGKYWIDGKPIYRKVIVTNEVVQANVVLPVAHGITDYDYIWVDMGNSFYYNTVTKRSLPLEQTFYTATSNTDKAHIYLDGSYIYYVSSGGWGDAWEKITTILYTKTTD